MNDQESKYLLIPKTKFCKHPNQTNCSFLQGYLWFRCGCYCDWTRSGLKWEQEKGLVWKHQKCLDLCANVISNMSSRRQK